MAKITINGEVKEIEGITLLTDLLQRLKLNAPYFAVAINDSVVPKSIQASTEIKEGDRVEVIHAVGGG